jgi:hypothetical protein
MKVSCYRYTTVYDNQTHVECFSMLPQLVWGLSDQEQPPFCLFPFNHRQQHCGWYRRDNIYYSTKSLVCQVLFLLYFKSIKASAIVSMATSTSLFSWPLSCGHLSSVMCRSSCTMSCSVSTLPTFVSHEVSVGVMVNLLRSVIHAILLGLNTLQLPVT